MIPRIRGRTAQIEEPVEDKGKWCYEVTMWDLSGEHQIGQPLLFGPFESEAKAKEIGFQIVRTASEAIEKGMTGEVSGRYLDLKNGGVMRPWEVH